MKRRDFSEETKLRCLLWSNRRCCVCEKECGLDIEVAHIDQDGGNNFDNAIPVCYTHHAEIGRYVASHPLGNKRRIKELKATRERVYEKYTRELVAPLNFYLVPRKGEKQIELPQVGFVIENPMVFLPAKGKVDIRVFLGVAELEPIVNPRKPYYSNGITWNLNAGHTFFGNFSVPRKVVSSSKDLIIEANVTVIDTYERKHKLLPRCYNYVRPKEGKERGYWYTEPTSFKELRKFMYPKTRKMKS